VVERLAAFWRALDGVPVADDAEALYSRRSTTGRMRRANLERYLGLLLDAGARTLLVAEAPGWRGMTNTGVPFMSMRELTARPGVVTGGAAGDGFAEPTAPTAVWEASSRVVWSALARWHGPLPIAWAVFPHHPFVAGDRRTNRTPRPAEVRAGAPVALALLDAMGAERVVAVGRKAQGALAAAGIDAVAVRHPAQGGAAAFTAGIRALADPR
jgi:uracil-DNA glycosylase